ncbi:hypothetical protein C2G38_2214932 [Gigaspora rosea]|uniref:Uncharacterized protein n=1 Tax=Gigaspora rosea TaxID=44941 RepID=A0A397UIW2_9GLOM|nr:hypothetical protein C2G38_2214932 [Gigaspora rosea]
MPTLFIIARHLYNSVTNNKNIDLKVIVSYTNKHNRYTSMKNNSLTYLFDDFQLSTASSAAKVASQEEIDTHLNSIEENRIPIPKKCTSVKKPPVPPSL